MERGIEYVAGKGGMFGAFGGGKIAEA